MKRSLLILALLPLSLIAGESTWFKGNTHTHTFWSDGDSFPEIIVGWYVKNDYDFLVLSDHNTLSRGERWLDVTRANRKGALDAYKEQFPDAVKLDGEKVRLSPYPEVQELFSEQIVLIEGEEITDFFVGKEEPFKRRPVHINAMNLNALIKPLGGSSIRDVMRNNLRAVKEQEATSGQPILAHLNHPNFHYSVTAEDMAHVLEEEFFEVYNGHPGVNQLGNKDQLTPEEMWDQANAIRMRALDAPPLLGIASDDSHNYHGGSSTSGRGWVMVHAKTCSAAELINAMRAGDFYASSGVYLDTVEYDAEQRLLMAKIRGEKGVTYHTKIIGLRGEEGAAQVLAESKGTELAYTLPQDVLYVRAEVTSDRAHPNASFKGQVEQAWTQPVGWRASAK